MSYSVQETIEVSWQSQKNAYQKAVSRLLTDRGEEPKLKNTKLTNDSVNRNANL
jgi:hypothetical protein